MQSKIKRKFVSLILAASLAVSSLAAFPMNVFAGTGKNGVVKAPEMGRQQQLEAVKAELEQVKAQLTNVQTQLTNVQSELETTKNDLTNVQTTNADLQTQLTNVQSELETTKSELTNVQTTNTDLQTQLTNVQTQLTNVQTTNADLQTQLTNVQSELETLKSKVTEVTISGIPDSGKIDIGKEFTLTAKFSPEYAYADYKKVEWNVTGKYADGNDMAESDITQLPTDTTVKITVAKAGNITVTAITHNGKADGSADVSSETININVQSQLTQWDFECNYGTFHMEFDKNSTWQDMLEKYNEFETIDNSYAPEGKIIVLCAEEYCPELKNNASTHNNQLVSINDKVCQYPLSEYYLD